MATAAESASSGKGTDALIEAWPSIRQCRRGRGGPQERPALCPRGDGAELGKPGKSAERWARRVLRRERGGLPPSWQTELRAGAFETVALKIGARLSLEKSSSQRGSLLLDRGYRFNAGPHHVLDAGKAPCGHLCLCEASDVFREVVRGEMACHVTKSRQRRVIRTRARESRGALAAFRFSESVGMTAQVSTASVAHPSSR